jgi:hypothetical protein
MKIKNIILASIVGLSLVAEPAFAGYSRSSSSSRSSGFGSSRSSSSASRSSGISNSRSSGWANNSSKSTYSNPNRSSGWANNNSSWGNSSKITPSSGNNAYRNPSGADVALRNKSIQTGTRFQTRESAINDFKIKHADKYPTRFVSEPRIRPSYIPSYYTYGGTRYNIIYNPYYGGYGYWGPGHVWMMYDLMTDAIMLNTLMNNHGYYANGQGYYDNGGVVNPAPVIYHTSPLSGVIYGISILIFTTFILIILIICVKNF